MGKNQDPGSGIWDKHPGSATLCPRDVPIWPLMRSVEAAGDAQAGQDPGHGTLYCGRQGGRQGSPRYLHQGEFYLCLLVFKLSFTHLIVVSDDCFITGTSIW